MYNFPGKLHVQLKSKRHWQFEDFFKKEGEHRWVIINLKLMMELNLMHCITQDENRLKVSSEGSKSVVQVQVQILVPHLIKKNQLSSYLN